MTDNERDVRAMSVAADAALIRELLIGRAALDPWGSKEAEAIRALGRLEALAASASAVPPVTDNERDAETIREALLLSPPHWHKHEKPLAALARLVAALSAATTERDDGEWLEISAAQAKRAREAEERAEALAAQLQQAREALSWALDALELAFKRLDSVDEYSPEHYLIRQAGFDKARAALAAAAPATTEARP